MKIFWQEPGGDVYTKPTGDMMLAMLVLGAMTNHQSGFLDVALGLAALGFISIVAFARYITDKRMF